jgi:serine/threonine-protein phosphatase 6 regulatory ankyrin repeat subunit B
LYNLILYVDSKGRWLDVIDFLIEKQSSILQRNLYGRDALYLAFKTNSIDVIELLMSKNIDVKTPYLQESTVSGDIESQFIGTTYLHLAASCNSIFGVKKMMEAGLAVTAKTNFDQNPLHVAAKCNYHTCLEYMICNYTGDDRVTVLNEQDGDGLTVLHYAVLNLNVEMVKMLMSYKVCCNLKDREGKTPFDYVQEDQSDEAQEIAKLLIYSIKKLAFASFLKTQAALQPVNYRIEGIALIHNDLGSSVDDNQDVKK